MNKLLGKTALITGGSSGIGLATAMLFAEEGAQVMITGRGMAALEKERVSTPSQFHFICSDAAKLADIDELANTVKRQFGKLDVLFVNAGVAQAAPLELVTEAQFDMMTGTNLKGVFFTIQKLLPLMSAGASIIVTTSITNQLGSPNFSVYAACKAALRSLVQSFALELIPRGIRINALSPGPILTPMWQRMGLPSEIERSITAEVAQKSPSKRFGQPDEVARAALFFASDDSSYIVGDELVVDGGMSLL